jgi:hypothetical protein
MANNGIARTHPSPLVGPGVFLAATAGAGFWAWRAQGDGLQLLLAAAVVGLAAVLWFVAWSRRRAARRLNSALDLYAARHAARPRYRPAAGAASKGS